MSTPAKQAGVGGGGPFLCRCTRCRKEYTARSTPPMTPVCPSCREKAEKQDAAIAAKFNPKHTPPLPFGKKRAAKTEKAVRS